MKEHYYNDFKCSVWTNEVPAYQSLLTGFSCQHTSNTTVPAAASMAGIMYHQIEGNGDEFTECCRWLSLVIVIVLNIGGLLMRAFHMHIGHSEIRYSYPNRLNDYLINQRNNGQIHL